MLYVLALYIVSLGFAYQTRFGEATLLVGRGLSGSGAPTGFQDAITPPMAAYFYFAVWILSLTTLGVGFYLYGFLTGVAALAGFWFMVLVNRLFVLPKSDSIHFRRLILASIAKRHADYLKNGEKLRADAMAMLLQRAGVPVSEHTARLAAKDS